MSRVALVLGHFANPRVAVTARVTPLRCRGFAGESVIFPSAHPAAAAPAAVGPGDDSPAPADGALSVRAPAVAARPKEPMEGECCGNGCEHCVWVFYWKALNDFEDQEKRRAARG